jgi:hypothetical protein
MKNRNTKLTAVLFVVALALASIVQAGPAPGGGPTRPPPVNAAPTPVQWPPPPAGGEAVESPVITIHSTDNVTRGKTGSFVLAMNPALTSGGTHVSAGMYVNFSVSGTAIPGVDYELLVSPAYIGLSGYGVIQVKTLPNPRGASFRQAYSVIVTLEPGAGYTVGAPSSATMWIKP